MHLTLSVFNFKKAPPKFSTDFKSKIISMLKKCLLCKLNPTVVLGFDFKC